MMLIYRSILKLKQKIKTKYYDLEIPDEAKPMDSIYTAYTLYSKTWFHIGHSGDRFLHMGETSAGCITVTEKEKWATIYQYLILRRKDDLNIGIVEVQ